MIDGTYYISRRVRRACSLNTIALIVLLALFAAPSLTHAEQAQLDDNQTEEQLDNDEQPLPTGAEAPAEGGAEDIADDIAGDEQEDIFDDTGIEGDMLVDEVPLVRFVGIYDAKSSGVRLRYASKLFYDIHNDEIYILDRFRRTIFIINPQGAVLYSIDIDSSNIGMLPVDFAVDKSGDIYVLENKRLAVLDYRGVYKGDVDISEAARGEEVQSFALSSEGLVYLGLRNRVVVIDSEGTVQREIKASEEAPFKNVKEIVVMGDEFYVLDPPAFKVYRFSKDGVFLSRFGKLSGLAGGFSMPVDMTIVPKSGRIAVLDANRFAVIIFNRDGEFYTEYGGTSQLPRPNAVTFDTRGRFYVAVRTGLVRVFEFVD